MTVITVERAGSADWLVTVERGNADELETLTLTNMERQQLAALLDSGETRSVKFEDVTA